MSGRRAANNRIRGPQSALTDFLASNNISAAQIHADFERRQREARDQEEQDAAAQGDTVENKEADDDVETSVRKKKRKRLHEKTLAKLEEGKALKHQKKKKSDAGSDEEGGDHVAWDMYTKKKPLPGQLENCDICEKRFTVTPYSKTGPDGGLLCAKCSKEQEGKKRKDDKPKKQAVSRDKRRQVQSSLLDGIVQIGSKSLQELCIKEVANNIHEVDEFGDLPQSLLNRLSRILSRRRFVNSRTINLFLRPDLETIDLYDCGKLEIEDYIKLFSVVPRVQNLNLRNAGQFKDEVVDYIIERDVPIVNLQLEAANLVSNEKWIEYFKQCGHRLESLKISWLDYSMDENAFMNMIRCCPNLKRLKVKKCFQLGDTSLGAMGGLKKLEHLSLRFPSPTTSTALTKLILSVGSGLQTLSLENFHNADDNLLSTIRSSCTKLSKLRFTENDYCTDAGIVALFCEWPNQPLSFVDLSSNRSIDYAAPDGPDDPIGLASAGFEALMQHSGSSLERLDISSCRHITFETFMKVFDGKTRYPLLKDINMSFLTKIDTAVVSRMFKSCPQLVKVTAFGCFNITDVAVPKGVALIGLPNAQDSIVQEGDVDADPWLNSRRLASNSLSKV